MSESQHHSSLNPARAAGTTFGPNDGQPSSATTPGMCVGQPTLAGHSDNSVDNVDNSSAKLPNSKIGPQKEVRPLFIPSTPGLAHKELLPYQCYETLR